jgi:hypothetical protein
MSKAGLGVNFGDGSVSDDMSWFALIRPGELLRLSNPDKVIISTPCLPNTTSLLFYLIPSRMALGVYLFCREAPRAVGRSWHAVEGGLLLDGDDERDAEDSIWVSASMMLKNRIPFASSLL